jgi:hypothetical protein
MKAKAPQFVPSVKDYVSAFRVIEGQITKNQRKMLVEHYNSYCYITTATDMAIAAGYTGFIAANGQYGRLGSMISNALGLGSLGVITIALMVPPYGKIIREWLWVMRFNVAEALEQLGWVEKTSHLFYPNGGVGVAKYIEK